MTLPHPTSSTTSSTPEPIAIVGMGCRFPGGANTPSKLWDLLCAKRDVQRRIPTERFDVDAFYDRDGERAGCLNVREAYTLDEDIRQFDAAFFKTNALEAEAMDPQQRLLLETVYEALESAGGVMEALHGSDTAVYVGVMTGDYHELLLRDPEDMPKYMATGTARSILSNRISYFFDWTGPSMTIDTACSSSLVAVHEAVQALRQGRSALACAAGANLILGPEMMISESKLHMLSPTGRSRMWDAAADGYARGEGFAAVMLKTLRQAVADGDYVHGVIRETGVNSDGRTNGITLPGADSQTALIRQTYARAGLDIDAQRCQYFEAHGTGTPAGDPIEARAIYNAFFATSSEQAETPLYVGSVKTAVGHLEGTAGLAGLVKAVEAVRRGEIPPNMLFESLNPEIQPFYHRLAVPTETMPWPQVREGEPRRASVNSFGFGGTNAHAIIESYDNPHRRPSTSPSSLCTPLVLSANSETSLRGQIEAFHTLLSTTDTPVHDILHTLQTRRSQHPVRATFSAPDRDTLSTALSKAIASDSTLGTRVDKKPAKPRILAVFTGQGAQWPTMGREILRGSRLAQQTLSTLQSALDTLPDGPDWSLTTEILTDKATSRLASASVAQPLCTAVQILLVDLLRQAGLTPSVVVGHSSGEIAAAYAAGMISAAEAIRIAYYRGAHAGLARGPDGQRGAMMAVGMSYDEATEFCEESFADRIEVAASNAPSSVTLSGDEDAIAEARAVLESRGVFARPLRVDTAYHSAHMIPCSEPYLDSLAACGIAPQQAREGCVWVSSVHGARMEGYRVDALTGEYWNDNMVSPVMFSSAVEVALSEEAACDVAIEIGAHPALKGPFTQTAKQVAAAAAVSSATPLPYSGTLSRGQHDLEALSETLGFVWTHLGAKAVDFAAYTSAFTDALPQWAPDLPRYSWDHRQSFWRESTKSANLRSRAPRHPLLGVRSTEDLDQEMRWAITLRTQELPWLEGHKVEGQVIYPAAAYLVMAMEAAHALVGEGQSVQVLELCDVEIANAIPLSEDGKGVEVQFTLVPAPHNSKSVTKSAQWACYARTAGAGKSSWRSNARGTVRVVLGSAADADDVLPPRNPPTGVFHEVKTDRFYEALTAIGLHYTGPFRGLDSVQRRSGTAMATVTQIPAAELAVPIHPAVLDAAFQTLFAAYCWPEDGSLRAPFVPTGLQSLRIVNRDLVQASAQLTVDACITHSSGTTIIADLDLSSPHPANAGLIQLQGLRCSSLTPPGPRDYKELYTQTAWEVDLSSGLAPLPTLSAADSPTDLALVDLSERLAYYYLRHLNTTIPRSAVPQMEWHHQRIFSWIDHLFPLITSGKHPTIRPEWSSDTKPQLLALAARYPHSVDLQLIRAVGEHLPAVVRGEAWMLEHMVADDTLDRFYKFGLGFARANGAMGRAAAQIAHRYPAARILEIGAGTGGATKGILEALDGRFERYTFTDISTGFFEAAAAQFERWAGKMSYRALDVEKELGEQGWGGEEGGFDVIVASNVLHATKSLRRTMENVRRLLKPGGFLLLLEVTSEIVRVKLMMAGLPGWWLGGEDGRRYGPTITVRQWDALLKETGFAGVDHVVNDFVDERKYMTSVMVTQAVDADVRALREPLNAGWILPPVTVVGGQKGLAGRVVEALGGAGGVQLVENLEGLFVRPDVAVTSLVMLEDFDRPVLEDFTPRKLEALQRALPECRQLLWVSGQCREKNPHGNMAIGLCRAIAAEQPHIQLQHLDIEDAVDAGAAKAVAEALVRLVFASQTRLATKNVLWTCEPELVRENAQWFVPRIVPDKRLNDQLNARKMVVQGTTTSEEKLELVKQADRFVLSPALPSVVEKDGAVEVKATHALVDAVQLEQGPVCVVSGNLLNQPDVQVVAFTNSVGSVVTVSEEMVFAAEHASPSLLQTIAFGLVADEWLHGLSLSDVLVLHQADEQLGRVLRSKAAEAGVKVVDVRTHAYASERSIRAQIPPSTKLLVDFAESSVQWERIIPTQCKVRSYGDAIAPGTSTADTANLNTSQLQRAVSWTQQQPDDATFETIPAAELANTPTPPYHAIVSFSPSTTVPTITRPINPALLFRPDRTYLLVGCTGGLGQSLCRWMVLNGARHLALTTRNRTRISTTWLADLSQLGVNVQLFEADVADMASLTTVHKTITASMPPVAGIANAAMVLSDRSFGELKHSDFTTVFGPKVQGTKNLDTLFHSQNLDFFIMFSSLASIVGNRGQSNYVAANLFMSTVAAQRRARGLAASVFHIGMVLGVGYVSTTGVYETTLRQYRYMPIAEPEFWDMFAQAIVIGHPALGGGHTPEMITGLHRHSLREEAGKAFWAENPRFSLHTVPEESQTVVGDAAAAKQVPLAEAVAEAGTLEAVDGVIQEAFVGKMERMLQAARGSIERGQPLINLGVDSLIAVEIRSWFLKELEVDMPVLKLVGGMSVGELCREAAGEVLKSLPIKV
ncbi:ketoacyl-synt-domain-containing protein [Aspergillus aculeatinus CBS 121060]|uniref:Ketoacyl-synt-domain-containing protein n=1 Tax=Aspergillus aculeatinus CBS 121060 TaxID=1448322 RepID=A0ACD1H4K9_9EURO|nr:ketoacyl-synt-domain-containing protein [Aspergillus aculeatinus CBS 121060]RAH68494.1 ketoacyl-synt-domain-containing protein [Aspergillus aculeatinus CBS 121060]